MANDLRARYAKSIALLERAEKTIPLGAQTFSKSRLMVPEGASPYFLERGLGGRVWDVDGNEYVDLVCGLLPVVLGYCDPDVDAAVRDQLGRGISFSLSTALEVELSETLTEIIPCAEMVRFGKNGSDATAGAVRLARAVTGRERIAAGGYHGWQDWYIGATTRSLGVPESVRGLTTKFPGGDIEALRTLLEAHPGEFAAVIMEPMGAVEPPRGHLQAVKDLAHEHGALFILDEIITGFRFSLGGAQELFGVVPDLATFGKSLGNGMPIAAVVGKAEYMRRMEDIFYSFTFGGEALSLAASLAVIRKMRERDVLGDIAAKGERLAAGTQERIRAHGLEDIVGISGHPAWKILWFKDHPEASKEVVKTLFIKEMQRLGILMKGSHNICFAHTDEDLEQVLTAYDRTLATLAEELGRGGLEERLGCPAVRPVFAVR